jgi:Mce-associated membrane protein
MSRRRRLLLGALAVVTALAVAAVVLLAVADRRAAAVSDARTAATQAATAAAELVLGYDHADLDQSFSRALEVTTGEFREEYRRTSEDVVRQVAGDTRAVVRADVVASGVVSATAERVVVLLFVNQTTTSNRLDGPRTDQTRVRMTMVPEHGRWLVAAVDAL